MKVGASPSATRSIKSRRSILTERGTVTYEREYETGVQPFEVCFPDLCRKYGLVRLVYVKKEYLNEDFFRDLQLSTTGKKKKHMKHVPLIHPQSRMAMADDNVTIATTATTASTDRIDEDTLVLGAMYDASNRFVELLFYKLIETPRELIILVGFVARYYNSLKRIKINFCKINEFTIYELSKLVCVSAITEVDLDGSVTAAGNYGILFDNARITNISLSKCNINDRVCEIIASKICFQGPAERNLFSLNLSSNQIMDAGAKHLSNALRSNRTLRYLNLADNQITDAGAGFLLDVLKEFQLTSEEKIEKRRRYMDYEKKRLTFYVKYLNDCTIRNIGESNKTKPTDRRKSVVPKSSKLGSIKPKDIKRDIKTYTNEDYKNRAEMLAGEMMGPFRDPFQFHHVKAMDGNCYSKGNMVLCYLNLAFNNLSYLSVVKLLNVLQYQKDAKQMGQIGLLRVILVGNNLPVYCDEYAKVDEILNKCIASIGGRALSVSGRRKSRISRASVMPEKMLFESKQS